LQNIININGYNLYDNDIKNLTIDDSMHQLVINTINPNSYVLARSDVKFRKALMNSDFLIMDGQYFVFAPLLLKFRWVKKISGSMAMYHLLSLSNSKPLRVFFLGGSDVTLLKIKQRLKNEYPNIELCVFSPPFVNTFSETESVKMRDVINNFCPDILFVGLTAPKQEIWANENYKHLNVKIICCVGAAFDWLANTRKQPGKIWVKFGLEWLHRTIHRPEILKRYPDYLSFFFLVIWDSFKKNQN